MADETTGKLPKNINKNIPTPNDDANEITGVIKYGSRIVGYEIQNGHQVDKAAAIEMAKNGELKGVAISVSAKGDEYLRSLPDDNESNNLSNLPTITIK